MRENQSAADSEGNSLKSNIEVEFAPRTVSKLFGELLGENLARGRPRKE
jgi:hypothetical protein